MLLRHLNASSRAADLVLPDIASASFLEVGRCGFFHLPLPHSAKYIPFRSPLEVGRWRPNPHFSCFASSPPSASALIVFLRPSFLPAGPSRVAEAMVVKPKSNYSSQRRKRVIFGLGIGLGAGGVVLAGGWMFTVGVAAAAFLVALSSFKVGDCCRDDAADKICIE